MRKGVKIYYIMGDRIMDLEEIIKNPESFKIKINLEKINNAYIDRIDNATSEEELEEIKNDQTRYKNNILYREVGYKRANEVPKNMWKYYQKINQIINTGFTNIEYMLYQKRLQIMASSQLPYVSHITNASGDNHGGKHKSRRNKKSKKSIKSKFRKNRRKSIRNRDLI
jgi:hypothetical protein